MNRHGYLRATAAAIGIQIRRHLYLCERAKEKADPTNLRDRAVVAELGRELDALEDYRRRVRRKMKATR